jgi:hypothetical protein
MSTTIDEDVQSSSTDSTHISKNDLLRRLVELEEKVDRQQQTIDEQSSRIDEQSSRIDEQSSRIDELENKVAQLKEDKDRAARQIAETKADVHDVQQSVEALSDGETPTPNDGQTGIQQHELTPIEQIAQSDDVDAITDSPSVRRAVSIFRNIADWGSRTPKGLVLKSSDNPLSLLSAARDSSLCWKQFYRAAECLESLSEGAVTFVDSDRHGKMLILHEHSETYQRMMNGAVSSSSAAAST